MEKCSRSNSPAAYSTSTTAATRGTSSPIGLGSSCPSDCATGLTGSDQRDLVLDAQLPTAPRGERPLPPHGAAWGAKQAGEADRGLPGGRKSAEPAKAGCEGTSDPKTGPASKSAMERETEPMAEAPSEGSSPTRKWVRQSQDLWSADAQLMGARQGRRGNPKSASGKACKARRPDSTRGRVGSYSGRRATVELGNPPALPPLWGRLAEATGDHARRGRSPRSSPRAGKPSTWRRRAVDAACKQERDACPTR
jgi:hypothetical protein